MLVNFIIFNFIRSSYLISCLAHIPFRIGLVWIELNSAQLEHNVYAVVIRIFRIKWMECHYQNYFKWNLLLRFAVANVQCCRNASTENCENPWTYEKARITVFFRFIFTFIYSNILCTFGQCYVSFFLCLLTLFFTKTRSLVWLHLFAFAVYA